MAVPKGCRSPEPVRSWPDAKPRDTPRTTGMVRDLPAPDGRTRMDAPRCRPVRRRSDRTLPLVDPGTRLPWSAGIAPFGTAGALRRVRQPCGSAGRGDPAATARAARPVLAWSRVGYGR